MITKAHIFSFLMILLLYAGVAIWKWTPLDRNLNEDTADLSVERLEAPKNHFWKFYNKATELRSRGLYKEAAEQYSRALDYNSDHKDALYYAGSMYLMTRDFEKANENWNRLLTEEPNAPRTHLQLGTLHFCMSRENPYFDLGKADQFYSEAWKLNLEETGAPLLLTKIDLLNNNLESAKELLADILSLNSTNEQALFLMGYLNWRSEDNRKAYQLLSKVRTYSKQYSGQGHSGEGATKSGNAMLLQGRFCDTFEKTISDFQNQPNADSPEAVYSSFETQMNQWRRSLSINID